mmetsp:Transcript_92130/g.264040  ORF Transcript_92130/g.264040 Transcript_92130/m.264040 type:complete len:230 (+) Transcript_92130:1395-2084(+)
MVDIRSCKVGYAALVFWTSMHWSLTQFTPASMEVFPGTMAERTYSVVILLFAMVEAHGAARHRVAGFAHGVAIDGTRISCGWACDLGASLLLEVREQQPPGHAAGLLEGCIAASCIFRRRRVFVRRGVPPCAFRSGWQARVLQGDLVDGGLQGEQPQIGGWPRVRPVPQCCCRGSSTVGLLAALRRVARGDAQLPRGHRRCQVRGVHEAGSGRLEGVSAMCSNVPSSDA